MSQTKKHFPACHIVFPKHCEGQRASFYLAAEEYIAKTLEERNYYFSWQLSPTCVFGRNQIPHTELDIDFCNANGIDLCRRKSGGGTIFADQNNIMNSLITPTCDVESLFTEYAETVAAGLRKLGAPAKVSGRNDIILEDGRKICGNAFYYSHNRNIVHGTMLYDTDIQKMLGALTPDKAKLKSKGVVSVKSRIGCLKDFFDFDVSTLRKRLIEMLTDDSYLLTEENIKSIREIEETYNTQEYLWGHNAKSDISRIVHIDSCGTIQVNIKIQGSLIDSLRLTGDFFEVDKNAEKKMNNIFHHIPYTYTDIKKAIEVHQPEKLIRNLSAQELLKLVYP